MFQVNEKIICVDDAFDSPSAIGRERPVKGRIYAVEGVMPNPGYRVRPGVNDDGYVVHLVGLYGGWSTFRFRRMSEVKSKYAAESGILRANVIGEPRR